MNRICWRHLHHEHACITRSIVRWRCLSEHDECIRVRVKHLNRKKKSILRKCIKSAMNDRFRNNNIPHNCPKCLKQNYDIWCNIEVTHRLDTSYAYALPTFITQSLSHRTEVTYIFFLFLFPSIKCGSFSKPPDLIILSPRCARIRYTNGAEMLELANLPFIIYTHSSCLSVENRRLSVCSIKCVAIVMYWVQLPSRNIKTVYRSKQPIRRHWKVNNILLRSVACF